MNLFDKLNFSLKDFDMDKLKGDRHTFYGNPPKPRISYYLIKDKEYFDEIMPHPICKIPPDTLFLAEIEGAGLLSPHRDHNVSCCVNYYFETNESVTLFHKEKENINAHVYPGKTTANIYSFDQVDTVARFKAEKNECYLLNVSEIHSVYAPNAGVRRMITWQWRNTPYEEILKNIIQ